MYWQRYLLLAALTPLPSYAGVLLKREQACGPASYSPESPSKLCPDDYYCDWSERICRPQLATRAILLPTTQSPRNERECKPLGFLSDNPSKWCPDDQYCDPFQWVCKDQLATRATPLHATQLPISESQTSLSNPEEGIDFPKRESLDITGEQACQSPGQTPKRCPVGQYCDPFVWVCMPIRRVRAKEAKIPKHLLAISNKRECDPSGFRPKWCPGGQYCDVTEYVCRPRSETKISAVIQATPAPVTQSPSPETSSSKSEELIDTSKRNPSAYFSKRDLPAYEQRECYPYGDYGGPEKWCPAGQFCDTIDYVCRPDARVGSKVARIASPPSMTQSSLSETHPNNAAEFLGFPTLVVVSGSGSGPGPSPAPQHPNPGSFAVVGSSGVPAMHAALMPNGRVVFLDKVEDYSPLHLADGGMAFSSEFDPVTRQVIPLAYKTNAFCSAGTFLADGRVISVGGNGPLSYLDPTVADGFDGIRYLERSATDQSLDGSSWSEPGNKLASKRWYASAQTMPDGSVFVASGSLTGLVITNNANNNPTYEILDANATTTGRNVAMDILVKNQPYYLYPFLHLLRDGSLFVFASKSSQIFNVSNNRIVREMPDLFGLYRTYPDSGGSVLLPLTSQTGYAADVIICGGGAYVDVTSPTEASCGRIKPESDKPDWEMDAMPEGRVMVEGTLLPDGTVLWLNGAQTGAQGFGIADDPALEALIYDPEKALGQRWSVAGRSNIPRLYHSVAVLLLDGTVLVAGGNPNEQPVLSQNVNPSIMTQKYPTEYRVEIYTPPNLIGDKAAMRPQNVVISTDKLLSDGSTFEITFTAPPGGQHGKVLLSHGGFITHGLHMGQRMVVLDHEGGEGQGGEKRLRVHMPEARWGNNVLPPGPYVLYVVVDGVPSIGQFVMVE
jgi:hypothetical protein